ncbi:MAG: hypothetical protein ACRD2J_16905 [Thermoanaerobaculia bacterium]
MTCDRDRIYDLVENPALVEPAVEKHLETCASCMELYGEIQELALTLADAEVWGGDEPAMNVRMEAEPGLDRLVTESLRLTEEEFRAAAILEDLRARPVEQWHVMLRQFDGVCTVGLVRELLGEGRRRAHIAPREFEQIATLAIEAADALDPSAYLAGVVERARGQAWKDRANALRLCGEIQDALWSLDEAERHYRQQPIPDFDLATVDYVRATVLHETDRLSEALSIVQTVAETFLEYGDDTRYRHAGLVEANLLRNLGSSREAREKFMALLKPTQQAGDLSTLAMLFLNIAHCSVDILDADTASIYFLQALNMSIEMGISDVAIASRWGLGRLLVSKGDYEQGIARLRSAARELEQIGADGDFAIIHLDILEALVALGRYDDVPAISRLLIDRFAKAGVQRYAMAALAYLREAAETRAVTPELVRHVRTYVERLPKQPELLFLPPPP